MRRSWAIQHPISDWTLTLKTYQKLIYRSILIVESYFTIIAVSFCPKPSQKKLFNKR